MMSCWCMILVMFIHFYTSHAKSSPFIYTNYIMYKSIRQVKRFIFKSTIFI